MEKRKKVEYNFLLPGGIIHRIQSFLTRKEAARTTILSKSWYNAWLTRPNLDFDQEDFGSCLNDPGDEKGFWEFAEKTMQRYEESNLRIVSFWLLMRGRCRTDTVDYNSYSRANELIVKAMEMGATDVSFTLQFINQDFALPHEVLGSETLTRLSMVGCKIGGKVSCLKLKFLNFRSVYIEGDLIWDIISSCPLIEKLSLSRCRFMPDPYPSNFLALSPFIEFGKQNRGTIVDRPVNLYEFRKIKCLSLCEVNIHPLFFHDLSSKFPWLKDLRISHCSGFNYKGIKISSHSLECISFSQDRMLRADLDFPSIRKFTFFGFRLPCIALHTTSSEWESDISVTRNRPTTLWFLKLYNLLTSLRMSKISLSLVIWYFTKKDVEFHRLPKILPIVVENLAFKNLTLSGPSSVFYALLDCLFWSFSPKFIIWFPKPSNGKYASNGFLEILWKKLLEGTGDNYSDPKRNMVGLHDLEEVSIELFEDGIAVWRPLPEKILLDASKRLNIKRKFRFKLRWG